MNKSALSLFIMLGTGAIVWGQTSVEHAAKYRRIVSYEVHPGVVMTPKYTADGHVCEMLLERQHGTESGIDLESYFSDEEVKALVDELAPEAERGKNLTELLNETIDGRVITTKYTYENVLILVYGVINPEDFVRQPHPKTERQKHPSESLATSRQCAGYMLITITWRKRECAKGQKGSGG